MSLPRLAGALTGPLLLLLAGLARAQVTTHPPEAQLVAVGPVDTQIVLTVAPNPARAAAIVRFALDTPAGVRVSVHDVLGREVGVVADATFATGSYVFNVPHLPAGVFVVRARVEVEGATPGVATHRFTVVR